MRKFVWVLGLAAAIFLAPGTWAFTAITNPAADQNAKGAGNTNPGAQVGDTFVVPDGSFATYIPGPGDPTITGGDLGSYQFTLQGTVSSVTGNIVDYTGTYRIFYDLDNSHSYDAGDPTVSAGTLSLTVNFNGLGPIYVANGSLHQTTGPSNPAFTPFAETDADFVGTYTQNTTDPTMGTVQGTIQSVPEPASMAFLLFGGVGLLGAMMRNRMRVASARLR